MVELSGDTEGPKLSVTIVGAAVVELSGDMDGPELSGAAVGAVGAELCGAAAGVPCEQTVEPGHAIRSVHLASSIRRNRSLLPL